MAADLMGAAPLVQVQDTNTEEKQTALLALGQDLHISQTASLLVFGLQNLHQRLHIKLAHCQPHNHMYQSLTTLRYLPLHTL